MKKKTTVIATSVASMAICASLIAGSTFALFTSESTLDITVSSGNVAVSTTIGALTATTSLDAGYLATGEKEVAFQTGGSASITEGGVKLDKIVPGDSVSFNLNIDNSKTTVKAKYRISYEVTEGYILADGLEVKIGGVAMEDENGSYKTYASAWDDKIASTVAVEISLPNHGDIADKTDNLYMGLNTNIRFTVEAVQGNAVTTDSAVTYLPDTSSVKEAQNEGNLAVVSGVEELKSAKTSEKTYIVLADNLTLENKELSNLPANTVIDANGNEIIEKVNSLLNFTGENITVKNAKFNAYKAWGVWTDGGVSFINCDFNGMCPYIEEYAEKEKPVVVDGCTFTNTGLQLDLARLSGDLPQLIVTNNVFNVSNTNEGVHAIVIGGGSPEFWADKAAETITIENNTFNAVYSDRGYTAYYFYAYNRAENLIENAPVYANNTFNGNKVYYCLNGIAVNEDKTLLVDEKNVGVLRSVVETRDFKNAEETLAQFCPACVNHPEEDHATHTAIAETIRVDENRGVMQVIAESAFTQFEVEFDKYNYDVSVIVDLSLMENNEFLVFDSGLYPWSVGGSNLTVGIKNVDGKYYVRGKVTADFAVADTDYVLTSAKCELTWRFEKNAEGMLVNYLLLDGQEIARYGDSCKVSTQNIQWQIYNTPKGNAGTDNVIAEVSQLKLTAFAK